MRTRLLSILVMAALMIAANACVRGQAPPPRPPSRLLPSSATSPTTTVIVPSVVGMSISKAEAVLKAARLLIQVTPNAEAMNARRDDIVFAQQPRAGSRVVMGAAITVNAKEGK